MFDHGLADEPSAVIFYLNLSNRIPGGFLRVWGKGLELVL